MRKRRLLTILCIISTNRFNNKNMSKLRFQTVEEMVKEVAEKAIDEYVFEGKTIRQWVEIILRDRDAHRWIPCSERLPDDADDRFYMCVVENHEEDPPMFCQYEEEKNMALDFGTIFLIPLVWVLLIPNFKLMRNWAMKK